MGFHSTPVLSIATCVTPAAPSQSASASRSAVIVPNVRTSFWSCPSASGTIRQATTVRLCRSSPQQRAYTTSILAGSFPDGRAGSPLLQTLVCVLPLREQQAVVPRGLPGPTTHRARGTTEAPTSSPAARPPPSLPPAPHFHP